MIRSKAEVNWNIIEYNQSNLYLVKSQLLNFHYNNIANAKWLVYIEAVFSDIESRNNWWGSIYNDQISAKIHDGVDDEELGIVKYDPFSLKPLGEAGISIDNS
jgi:hypothetical protein